MERGKSKGGKGKGGRGYGDIYGGWMALGKLTYGYLLKCLSTYERGGGGRLQDSGHCMTFPFWGVQPHIYICIYGARGIVECGIFASCIDTHEITEWFDGAIDSDQFWSSMLQPGGIESLGNTSLGQ